MVLATDKKLGSKLVDKKDVRKLEKITPSCGFVYSGVGPDYRVLVQKAFPHPRARGGASFSPPQRSAWQHSAADGCTL
mgnify:CR=1 FL=1